MHTPAPESAADPKPVPVAEAVREPEDGDVTRWREVAKLTGHTGDVKSVAVSGDGSRIVTLAVIVSAWSVSVRVEEERR